MATGMMELAAKLTGWDPYSTVGQAKEFSHRYAQYDYPTVERDFDFKFRPFEETMIDSFRWYGFLQPDKISPKVRDKYPPAEEWLTQPNPVPNA